MREVIRQRALELGFEACRFTTATPPESAPHLLQWLSAHHHGTMAYLERNSHKRTDPQQVLPAAKSFICLAASYTRRPDRTFRSLPQTEPAGVVARYARYADYHDILGKRLVELARFIDTTGGAETCSLWYVDTGPILERDIAQRAGLGFIGKHTNLVGRDLGNWFFLAEIVTTLELPPDAPEKNRCGSCTRCISACPTGAITAPFQLDARRCISYLTIELKGSIPMELREAIGNRIYGCDDCLAACPWNRFAREGRLMKEHARPDLDSPALLDLLAMGETEFKQRFAGTPMLRAKRRGLLRNVCVALGNIGDEAALPGLERASKDAEPLVAEHASWAIDRIRKRGSGPCR